MPSNGAPKAVGDYVKIVRGSTYKGELVGKPGPPLLGLGSIEAGGGFRIGKYKTFGGECPTKWMAPPGAIYVALKGATKDGSMVGSVARLPLDMPAGRLTQDTARLDFLDTRPETANYLYWILRTPQYRTYCEGRVTGSASASFSREDFFNFPVPAVTDAAMAIVESLETIEQKIEQNRRTGAKLEGLARAVFKAWFVDFEPVKAKAAGATAFPGMPPETFDALPTRLEDSEFGPVPQGWNVETLRDMATFITGGTPSKANPSFWNGMFPWVSAKDMHSRIVSESELRLSDAGRDSVRRLAPRHSTLMVIRGMSLMTEVRIGWCTREVAFNQDLRAFIARGDTTPEFIHLWLTSSEETLMQMVDTASHGTGRILTDRLDRMAIARPPKAVMRSFTEITKPIMALRESLHTETAKLAALRDYLLPRLLSGQVRVETDEKGGH